MDTQLIYYFVNIVKFGSFTKAAEALKVPKSSVSKALTKLEQTTGTKLLIRSTRKQHLTDAGRTFYEACIGPIQAMEEAEKLLHGQDDLISGTIKITVPEDFELFLLSSCIQSLCCQYPDLKFIINSTNQMVNLVGEGYDFAIRIGPLEESNLRVRNIAYIKPITVVSNAYYDSIELNHPSDLQNVRCIGLTTNKPYQTWNLTKGDDTVVVKTPLVVETNQITSVHKLTLSGTGVSALPPFLCEKELASGDLVQVLADWEYQDVPVSLISPLSTINSARLTVVSDALVNALRQALF